MYNLLLTILVSLMPFVGAQIFVEPGQSPEHVDSFFQTLEENSFSACRIRMFESYMRQPDGTWDFSLFDAAFESAQKHNVQIWCTLFPETEKTDIGGWKFPYDEKRKVQFAGYIAAVTEHYKNHPALRGWVLINEPGIRSIPDTPFIKQARASWDKKNPAREFKGNGYPILMDTRDSRFVSDLNVAFLNWIASQVAMHDTDHEIHVNPHAVFDNYSQHNFPEYRSFLSSLGGSAHASWHFNFFDRNEYCVAMMAQSEILRSGAGDLPWFMTEIQAGNNTYSGADAMCPTPEEIRQWLWTIVGCEGKGGIFWLLNPRSSGIEAGEWAMIDFQGNPTERLLAAGDVARTIQKNSHLFSSAREIPSGIDIVYFRESAWVEKLMAIENDRYEGRRLGAVIKSAVACFRALSERGLNVGLKAFDEYDFSKDDYRGKTIVISNQISLPEYDIKPLEHFVACGGTLVVEGLSGFFDEDVHCTMNTGFGYADLLGGRPSEFILVDDLFKIKIGKDKLPAHLWRGSICGTDSNEVVSEYGKGKVVWIPSCIGLGAWTSKEYAPLSDYLAMRCAIFDKAVSFKGGHHAGMLLRSLDTEEGKVLVCLNKSGKCRFIRFNNVRGKAAVLFSDKASRFLGWTIVKPEGTIVLHYNDND